MPFTQISNYLEDDWDDNNLTGRTSTTEGYFLHPSDNQISDLEAGDVLKGVYRPEWITDAGNPATVSGKLELDTDEAIVTKSNFTTGAWKHDFTPQSSVDDNSGTGFTFISLGKTTGGSDVESTANCYTINWWNKPNRALRKVVSGNATTLIENRTTVTQATHTNKVTRDSYGNFEYFYDGSSQGTATDTTYTESNYLLFGNDSTSTVNRFDNLVVK